MVIHCILIYIVMDMVMDERYTLATKDKRNYHLDSFCFNQLKKTFFMALHSNEENTTLGL